MSPASHRHAALGLAIALGAAALVACGEEKNEAPVGVPAPPPAAPQSTAQPQQAPAPTAPTSAASPLPSGFPDDLPAYPGATPVASSQDGEEGLLVVFETGDAPDKVFAFYKEALAQQGWKIEGEMSSEDQHMLIGGKAARKATVMVATESGKTEINITVTKDEG